ncbi:hypothetical protein [Swinepox virus]|uniref:Uncharacterized protein n=1 Tax=Swinepox virus TaxID=10276 RepID=A0A881SY65_SWPV|nr:hypothetical protein [Swinepox virus]
MFVDDNTLIVYRKWTNCLINNQDRFILSPTKNSIMFDELKYIQSCFNSVLLLNPNKTDIIKICVHIKRTKWEGKIIILFEGNNKPIPFRLVNGN